MRNLIMSDLAAAVFVLITATTGILSSAAIGDVIATEIHPETGRIYHLLAETGWEEAEVEAVSLGGHLVTINDIEEHDWLWSTFGSGSKYNAGVLWIGINDIEEEGTFVWTSGASVDFTNWGSGEPSNSFPSGENWGAMWTNVGGLWNDFGPDSPEGTQFMGIVEDNCPPIIINVPNDYATIQEAIDASCDGQEIVIAPGVYHESILIGGKAITLRSIDPDNPDIVASTIINANTYTPPRSTVLIINAEGPDTVLDGLTITGGQGTDFVFPPGDPNSYGGGMICNNTSPTIRNCVFVDNTADIGGGMHIELGDPTVTNCSFISNIAGMGGGVAVINNATPTLSGCMFIANIATGDGSTCCYPSHGPGCDDADCEKAVCEVDPFCCNNWDEPCTFLAEELCGCAGGGGGGLYLSDSDVTIDTCEIISCIAHVGGGVLVESTDVENPNVVTLLNCTITNNTALLLGGGVRARRLILTLSGCTLSGNLAERFGGGMSANHMLAYIYGCLFENNQVTGTWFDAGGGGIYNAFVVGEIGNSSFIGNESPQDGGGIFNRATSIAVENCIFESNEAEGRGGAIYEDNEGNLALRDCIFDDNNGGWSGGVFISGGGELIQRCIFKNNLGGGLYSNDEDTDTFIIDCVFDSNQDTSGAGFGSFLGRSRFYGCIFRNNITTALHGAMSVFRPRILDVVNCQFVRNISLGSSSAGLHVGGLHALEEIVRIDNCNFVKNVALDAAGGLTLSSVIANVSNCIFWENVPAQIQLENEAIVSVTYSDIEGGYPGTGNIDLNPLFVNVNGPDNIPGTEDDNLRLSPGSPCIDAADNTAVPKGIDTDLDGNPRFIDDPDTKDTGLGDPPIVDMGAYEFQGLLCPWDLDGSGSVGTSDLLDLFSQWGTAGPADFDGSGIVDTNDLLILFANWGPCA